MFASFADFFNALKTASFGFGEIWQYIVSVYYDVTTNPDISSIWNGFLTSIAPIYKTIMTIVVIACILVAFFGKKIKGFLSFTFFLVIGFVIGAHFLAPVIPDAVVIPTWLVGIVVGIVAAVIHRFLYYILYAVFVGYSVYILTFNGFYIASVASYTAGKAMVCLIISLVCVLLAFLFKKYVEMIGTAILGGWLASWVFANYIYAYNKLPLFANAEWLALLLPTVIIAVLGSIVQIKTRRRY